MPPGKDRIRGNNDKHTQLGGKGGILLFGAEENHFLGVVRVRKIQFRCA